MNFAIFQEPTWIAHCAHNIYSRLIISNIRSCIHRNIHHILTVYKIAIITITINLAHTHTHSCHGFTSQVRMVWIKRDKRWRDAKLMLCQKSTSRIWFLLELFIHSPPLEFNNSRIIILVAYKLLVNCLVIA